MTIQEAIKSEKRFRKTGESEWTNPALLNPNKIYFGIHDLLSDFEIEEEKIEITNYENSHGQSVCIHGSTVPLECGHCKSGVPF